MTGGLLFSVSAAVGFVVESEGWVEGETERSGREDDEGDLESRDEPRRLDPRLLSLPRVKLFGNNLDSNPDITAAIALRPCLSRGCMDRFRDAAISGAGDTSDLVASSRPKT